MRGFWNRQSRLLFLPLLMAAALHYGAAQEGKAALTIRIDQIVSSHFPNMTVYAIVENDRGEVVTGLSPGLFSFRIDSLEETGRARIVPLSMRELPIDYSIIFSNNGIMEDEPLDFQKNAILQFVESMKPMDQLSLYTVGEDAAIVFEETKKDAIDPSAINAVGVTSVQPRLYDSVINVMRRVQRRQAERKIVIVISDGRDQNSRFSKDQLNTVLAEVDVPVYGLGIRVLNTQSLSNLHEIAELSGGAYLFAPRLQDIPASLKSLSTRIAQPYVISLRVKSLKADNLPHVLEVAVNERDSSGRGQKTFTAVKVAVPRWIRWAVLIGIVLLLAALVVLALIRRIVKRRGMGITSRRCPDCNARMKDSWDSCPFCRYLPHLKKEKKEKKKKVFK